MEKLFYPESLVIFGLSRKQNNIPALILENLLRWGYKGRIFGVNARSGDSNVSGIKQYRSVHELPIVPDCAVALIPARYVPQTIEECGKKGIKRMAILSGGFNELGEEGERLSLEARETARKYGIRFMGPNGLTVANTSNGLCLPFVPAFKPPEGGLSFITQSGGIGIILWNLLENENIGLAKFASIGNKLDIDEVEVLEYFGRDPETEVIGMYLESISRGRDLIETAAGINKPIIILKSNTTEAGKRAAMSHTASLSNDEDIIDSAFERAGIIRIDNFNDFVTISKAFKMSPMKGKRIMVMSPAGGFSVVMADLCEKAGFEFADPGKEFYEELNNFSNAGVINFSNPLDMGDIYDPEMYAHIFYSVLHNENVDGAVYVSQWPRMPSRESVFQRMFNTDIAIESIGAGLSSGKPLAACVYSPVEITQKMKQNTDFPFFDSPNDMIRALKIQADFYSHKKQGPFSVSQPDNMDYKRAASWIESIEGAAGEETLDLLDACGIPVAKSIVAPDPEGAVLAAEKTGYPVVMKVVSPDALHKSEAGGVIVGLRNSKEVKDAFVKIRDNLRAYNADARFQGVRIMEMAGEGHDMFVGGVRDRAFGPVVFFGYGGIYIEVFRDVQNVLCPSNRHEIEEKLGRLKSWHILKGARGQAQGDIDGFVGLIERVSLLMARFPSLNELDLNPVRVLSDGSGVLALDARCGTVDPGPGTGE